MGPQERAAQRGRSRSGRIGPLGSTFLQAGFAIGLIVSSAGCSMDGLLNSDKLPSSVSDPAATQTPTGARNAYIGTLTQFRSAFAGVDAGNSFVVDGGLLTDELQAIQGNNVDRRVVPEQVANGPTPDDPESAALYSALQKVRGQASQAIGLLTNYLPDQPAMAGQLYAIAGYTELFLAELYCSGVPLGTLDYKGDYTYRPGSTTDQVLAHAVTLFDTALALAGDSARVMDMARVGRARALLGRGRYADAAAAVIGVADVSRYNVIYNNIPQGTDSTTNAVNFGWLLSAVDGFEPGLTWDLQIPDREGLNGFTWRTTGDPRVMIAVDSLHESNGTYNYFYHPAKYLSDGSSPVVLASGVEARLIEAEAALQANPADGQWLTKLNALRTDGTFDVTATSPPDTLWHAGTGGVAGLKPLQDPGTATGRIDLVFHERAFWLYLTGHRQGDLRRLIRQYGVLYPDVYTQSHLYPVGPYPFPGFAGPYGSDVTLPIPATEFANPLYTGCISRDA